MINMSKKIRVQKEPPNHVIDCKEEPPNQVINFKEESPNRELEFCDACIVCDPKCYAENKEYIKWLNKIDKRFNGYGKYTAAVDEEDLIK